MDDKGIGAKSEVESKSLSASTKSIQFSYLKNKFITNL